MRAKSIKNKARVNAELSPAELKQLLKKAQRDHANARAYIALLEQELAVWREGGQVETENWASMEKALGLAPGELATLTAGSNGAGASSTTSSNRLTPDSAAPRAPALDRLSDGESSRPMSPSIEEGEREEWLRRENDLQDQLAKAVSQRVPDRKRRSPC